MPRPDFLTRDTAHLSITALAAATNATFADYFMPIAHTPAGFAAFCRSFSLDVAQSVLLEHRDGRLAGLGMLGMRGPRGWCGGLGLVPESRGRGVSALLVDALLGRARAQSLASMQLEVLVQNTRAIRTYARAGFETRRDLVILSGETRPGEPVAGLDIRPAATPGAALAVAARLSAPDPCWQREVVSLLSQTGVRALTATAGGRIVGALLYRPGAPGGPLAVSHLVFCDEPAARALLARATADTGSAQVFILNEPEGSPLHALAPSLGLREIHRQHEMSLAL